MNPQEGSEVEAMSKEQDEVVEPKQDRIGNDYHEGPNPNPGGTIDTGDSLVPPYEDRAKGDSDTQDAKSESVKRQLTGKDPPEEANSESLVGPTGGKQGQEPPAGVGESVARRAEDMIKHHGKEAGRHDTGTDDSESERPTGESTPRDRGGVDPQEGPA
jgi:hypothetical protein